MPKPPGSNETTAAATRLRLLEAGRDEFSDEQSVDPFQNVELARVAERAGISRNGLAYHWKSKAEFSEALADYILGLDNHFDADFERMKREVRASRRLPASERLTRVADVDLDTLNDNPHWSAMEVLTIAFSPRNSELAERARRGYRQIDQATWSDVYGRIASDAGRVPRPPFTEEQVGTMLQTFVEGAGIRQLFDPEALAASRGDGAPVPRGAYAAAAAGLVALLTMPGDGSDDRDVGDLVRDLMGEVVVSSRPPRRSKVGQG